MADVDDVAAMAGELLEEIMQRIEQPVFNFSLADTSARLRAFIEQGKYTVFVARGLDGQACGFISLYECHALYAEGAFGTIAELFVREPWRSSQVGHHLLQSGKAFALRKGWRRLEVTTPPLPQFERTLDFYERQGFAISGGRKLSLSAFSASTTQAKVS